MIINILKRGFKMNKREKLFDRLEKCDSSDLFNLLSDLLIDSDSDNLNDFSKNEIIEYIIDEIEIKSNIEINEIFDIYF